MSTLNKISVFLDSNAIAALSLFFSTCKKVMTPSSSITTWNQLKDILERNNFSCSLANGQALTRGISALKKLHELQESCSDNMEIYISIFGDVEFRDVLLNQRFNQYLCESGFPYRILQKRPLRHQVKFDYHITVEQVCTDFYQSMEEEGFSISKCEDDYDFEEICSILNLLSHHIFMDAMDAYFYCAAIRVMANKIITYDEEFYSISNKMRTDKVWREQRDSFARDLVANFTIFQDLTERKARNFLRIFPEAIKP